MIEILRLLAFLVRISRRIRLSRATILLAVVVGVLSGLANTGLIMLINKAITDRPSRTVFYGFAALCIAAPLSRFASQALLNSIGARAVFDLRILLCRKVLATPLRHLEEIGPSKLLASLTDDVGSITNALVQVPPLAMHLTTVVACLAYMGWLSWKLLLAVLALMVLGVATYSVPLRTARRYATHLREAMDVLFKDFRGLTDGAKELKLNRSRREIFFDSDLIPAGEVIRHTTAVGSTLFSVAPIWGNLLFFIVFGLLVFAAASSSGTDLRVIAGYVMALLLIRTPIEALMLMLPVLNRAAVATRKLDRLNLELMAPEETREPATAERPPWRRLELVEVTHTYGSRDGGEGFTLGPVKLAFEPGEIIFLTGGNGSGKTTLAKVLMGLYPPESGEILLDGEAVTDWESYRQRFSAVFADFYLFTDLPETGADVDAAAARYLAHLQLDHKVTVEDGKVSTLDLSQGQRKRLALLSAYFEDRSIYFFDEWAADQDPHYKAVFYREILPELKARGKTVFVISHDDQYYGAADRLIKLGSGRVEWDRPQDQMRS